MGAKRDFGSACPARAQRHRPPYATIQILRFPPTDDAVFYSATFVRSLGGPPNERSRANVAPVMHPFEMNHRGGFIGRRHRAIDVGPAGQRDLRQLGAVVGVEDRERLATSGVDELAPDEEPGLHAQNVTGTLGILPSAIIWGRSPEAFSQTRSIERFGE